MSLLALIASCDSSDLGNNKEEQDTADGENGYVNPDLRPFAAWLRSAAPVVRSSIDSEIGELIESEMEHFDARYSYVQEFFKIVPNPRWEAPKIIRYDEGALDIFILCGNTYAEKIFDNDLVLIISKRGDDVFSHMKMLPRDESLSDRLMVSYREDKVYVEVGSTEPDGTAVAQYVGYIVRDSTQTKVTTRAIDCWEVVTKTMKAITFINTGDDYKMEIITQEDRRLVCADNGIGDGVEIPSAGSGGSGIPPYTSPFPPGYEGSSGGGNNSGSGSGGNNNYGNGSGDGSFSGGGGGFGFNGPWVPDGGISIIPNPGSGGGGNPPGPNPVVAPKAKKIFRNSKMTDQNWEKIEKMLDKIIANCMGEALYDGLVTALGGKTLTFEFIIGEGSGFNYGSGGISLSNTMESNRLFHEMWHAYQAYQETDTTYSNSLMNLEIEAWYAQYLYVSSLPDYKPGTTWYNWYNKNNLGKSIQNIKEFIDNKGNFILSNDALDIHLALVESLFRAYKGPGTGWFPYKNYPYDDNRIGIDNFQNLKNLSSNCN